MRAISLLVSVAMAIFACVSSATAACEGDSPESVLECYASAYSDRDLDALEMLYADDYVWVIITPPGAEMMDRAMVMQSAKGMFTDPKVQSVSLTFEGEPNIVGGGAKGTWRIEGVEAELTTVYGESQEHHTARTCATFYVREADGKLELFREVTLGDGDCSIWEGLAPSE